VTFIPSLLVFLEIYERWLLRNAPRYNLIHELILVLMRLTEGGAKFSHNETKRYIISHLEQSAICLSIGIPKSAALPTLANRAILQEKCSGAANAIRALQVGVALPDSKTQEHLETVVLETTVAVAHDTLDSLPRETASDNIGRRSRVMQVVRTVIVSIVPLVVLLTMRYAGLRLSSAFNNWAIIIAIIWAVITILSLLDPLYESRLKVMGDFISTIRGQGS
jgi:hypothetical protein